MIPTAIAHRRSLGCSRASLFGGCAHSNEVLFLADERRANLHLLETAELTTFLTTGHHFEEQPAKIFGLRDGGQDGMIERLFETAQAAGGTAGVD